MKIEDKWLDLEYATTSAQTMRACCEHYIECIKEQIGEEYQKLDIDLDKDLETAFDYLRGYVDHLQYKEDKQILFTFGYLLEEYNIKFCLGTQKRFQIQMNKEAGNHFEADTLCELLDYCIPYFQKEWLKDELNAYERYHIALPKHLHRSDVNIKELYAFMKKETNYILQFGIAELYVLSSYKELPCLSAEKSMQELHSNLTAYHAIADAQTNFDFLMDYTSRS